MKLLNLSGDTFGHWIVLDDYKNINGHTKWLCRCVCGCEKYIWRDNLLSGQSTSCGCMVNRKIKHNKSGSKEYTTWSSMKQRCLNKKTAEYKNYGGRGIDICMRWVNSFENFYLDMGDKPPNKSLDRIDNNRGYYPDNCRWANPHEQCFNKRSNDGLFKKNKPIVAVKKRVFSETHKKNLSKARIGKHHSPQTIQKIKNTKKRNSDLKKYLEAQRCLS
jgi:hypothetical protein